MPGLFTFAFTAELSMEHQMAELANKNEHIRKSAAWAERTVSANERTKTAAKDVNTEEQLMQLYRESIESSGVRIVPSLGLHHRFMNFWQEHPVKILAAASVPAVGYIFWGRSGQDHLQLQSKIMHTRVYGQFTVIAMLLSLIGFKSYMDSHGKFITQEDADERVLEMAAVRESLLERLHMEKEHKAAVDERLKKAHEEDVQTGQVHEKKGKKAKKHTVKELESVAV